MFEASIWRELPAEAQLHMSNADDRADDAQAVPAWQPALADVQRRRRLWGCPLTSLVEVVALLLDNPVSLLAPR